MRHATKRTGRALASVALVGLLLPGIASAQVSEETLKSISTPDKVETRIGTLKFFDGFPTDETVQRVYDNLDFLRGVEVFLNCCPGASLVAMREGMREIGAVDGTIAIFENFMDSNSLFLTPNTESVYTATWLDLKTAR